MSLELDGLGGRGYSPEAGPSGVAQMTCLSRIVSRTAFTTQMHCCDFHLCLHHELLTDHQHAYLLMLKHDLQLTRFGSISSYELYINTAAKRAMNLSMQVNLLLLKQ